MVTDHVEHIKNGRIYLRALDISDLERVYVWHNDQSLYEHLGGVFRWVSRTAEEAWVRQRCAYSATEVNLAICLVDTDEHIGNVYLRNIDWVGRHAELHILIGSAAQRGKGYGKEAIELALAHAFNDLGLERIYLFVLASNETAQRLYRKCGFIEEGRLRKHAYKQGEFIDVIVMGLLKSEWKGRIG